MPLLIWLVKNDKPLEGELDNRQSYRHSTSGSMLIYIFIIDILDVRPSRGDPTNHEIQFPLHPNRQAFAAIFVQKPERPERPAVIGSVTYEVIRPDMSTIFEGFVARTS